MECETSSRVVCKADKEAVLYRSRFDSVSATAFFSKGYFNASIFDFVAGSSG